MKVLASNEASAQMTCSALVLSTFDTEQLSGSAAKLDTLTGGYSGDFLSVGKRLASWEKLASFTTFLESTLTRFW